MYTVKLINNSEKTESSIGYGYTALQCNHYEVEFRKDDSACIIVYPTFLRVDGVEYWIGEEHAFEKAYIENENGQTVDKIIIISEHEKTRRRVLEESLKEATNDLMLERREPLR